MRSVTLTAMLAMAGAVPASAQTMNAEAFHKRATRLEAKGMMAVFSKGEISTLMNEAKAAGRASSQRIKAERAAGRPRACPPEGKQKMGSDEFMKRLSAISLAERQRIDMTEAMVRIVAAKYPCPKA